MSSPRVSVTYEANVSGLTRGISEAATAVKDGGERMRGGLRLVKGGAEEAGGALDLLRDKLREHRLEMRQEFGMASMLGRELRSMGLDSRGAASEIAELAGAFAVGGEIGATIAGLKVVGKLFMEMFSDADEFGKKAQESLSALQKSLADVQAQEAMGLWTAGGGKGSDLEAVRKASAAQEEALAKKREIAAEEKKLDDFRNSKGEVIAVDASSMQGKELARIQETIELRRKELALIEQRGAALRGMAERAVDGTETGAAEKAAREAEATKRREEEEARRAAAAHAADLRRTQAEEQRAGEKSRQLAERHAAEVDAIRRRWSEKAASEEERIALQESTDLAKLNGEDVQARIAIEEAAQAEIAKIKRRAAEKEEKDAEAARAKSAAAQKRSVAEYEATIRQYAAPMESAVNQVAQGMISGHLNMASVLQSIWSQVVSMILSKIMAEIIANAALAGATAAAAEAAIPGIGPAAAIGAGTETETSVLSTFGSAIASAAGGWKVPHDTLAMVHQDEHILPASIARQYESGAPGGGSSAVTLNVHAMDGASVERVLMGNQGALLRALGEAARNGRRA